MALPAPTSSKDVAVPFKWKDRKGNMWAPEDMETRHLFFTLRMIWNHNMPKNHQLRPYRRYTFSEHYSPEYMGDAIKHIGRELFTRTDLKPEWVTQLMYMSSVFSGMQPTLAATSLKITDQSMND